HRELDIGERRAARQRRRLHRGGDATEAFDGAARRRPDAGNDLDERRFARAVRTDQRDELAAVQLEIDVVEDRPAAAARTDTRTANTDVAHRRSARCRSHAGASRVWAKVIAAASRSTNPKSRIERAMPSPYFPADTLTRIAPAIVRVWPSMLPP